MPITDNGNSRRLPFPLYNAKPDGQVVGEGEPITGTDWSWPVEDPDEPVLVMFEWSLNEFVAMASAIDVGRDIGFPENSALIWWWWVSRWRVVESFCEAMIECIENDFGVQSALQGWLGQQTQPQASSAMDELRSNDMAAELGSGCNSDAWWGASLTLVQRLNRSNEDALEIFEASTNTLDFAADVVGDITVIDETSLDAILSWVTFLQENIAENYLAQYTEAYEHEIACDIFCLALENCSLSAEQLFDYFWQRVGSSISWDSLLADALGYLVGRSWSGTQICDFMMLAQIGFRRFVARFTGGYIAFSDLAMSVRLGLNNPSSDWSIICDDCPENWSSLTEWPDAAETDWVIDPSGEGGVITANGLETTDGDPFPGEQGCGARIDFTDGYVSQIQVTGEIGKVRSGNGGIEMVLIGYVGGTQTYTESVNLPVGEFDVIRDFEDTLDGIRIRLQTDDDPPRSWYATTLLTGTGTKPPELP